MAKTDIADLNASGNIMLSNLPEKTKPVLGNGVDKAGALIYVVRATGKAAKSNVGTTEIFQGILLPRYDTEVDTAIPDDGVPTQYVDPTDGHSYRARCADPSGTVEPGAGWELGNGQLKLAAGLNDNVVCYNDEVMVTGDTVGEFTWGK